MTTDAAPNTITHYPTTTGTYPTDTDKIVAIDTAIVALPARVAWNDDFYGHTCNVQVRTSDGLARVYAAKCTEHGTRHVTITP